MESSLPFGPLGYHRRFDQPIEIADSAAILAAWQDR
jgi:hypothetical protein